MRIPHVGGTSNSFGNRGPDRPTPMNPDTRGMTAGLDATARTAGTVMQIGHQLAQQQAAERAQLAERDDALRRVEANNAGADYELRVSAAKAQFRERLDTGRIDFRAAPEEWESVLADIEPPPAPAGADEVLYAQFGGVLRQTQQRARLEVMGWTEAAKQQHIEAQAVEALNKNVMVAGMPGGNTAEAVARNTAMRPLLRAAGYDEAKAGELIGKANQAIYENEAKSRIDAAGADPETLNGILRDLTAQDGRYTGTLEDPNRRLVLANTVRARLKELATAAKQEADKREEVAKRVVSDVWKQAESGVRPTADMLTDWQTSVAGTPYEAEFVAAANALVDVQGVLRESPQDQAAYVQELRTKLASAGGSPEDLARIEKIEGVIEASNKQRETDPLLWLSSMTGTKAEPIDLQASLQSGDFSEFGRAVQSRMDDIAAVRQQFGPSVPMKPLLPQESKMLAKIVQTVPGERLVPMFGMMRAVIASEASYDAVMQQIAPDEPLKAFAGQIAVRPGGEKTASLILRGEALLAGKEGTKKFPMPPDKGFTDEFLRVAGNAYQGRPEALQRDLAASRAVYAASAAQDGADQASAEFDPERFNNSMRAVVGEVAEIGPSRVTVPWGVTADAFQDRAPQLMADALTAAGLDAGVADGLGLMPTSRPGRYILLQGRSPVWNPSVELDNGRLMPVFVDWSPEPPKPTPRKIDLDPSIRATLQGTR